MFNPTVPTAWVIRGTNLFPVNLDVRDVVLEHGRDVDFRKLVFAENNKQACFAASSVADNHQLLANGCHLCWETEGADFTKEQTFRKQNQYPFSLPLR